MPDVFVNRNLMLHVPAVALESVIIEIPGAAGADDPELYTTEL